MFHDGFVKDWRLQFVVDLSEQAAPSAETLTHLFAALHRLNINESHKSTCHYDSALMGMSKAWAVKNEDNWLHLLACAILLAQVEVSANGGINMISHLAAAVQILNEYALRGSQGSMLERCLLVQHHIYDLSFALIRGRPPLLELAWFNNDFYLDRESTDPLESIWARIHQAWAHLLDNIAASENGYALTTKKFDSIMTSIESSFVVADGIRTGTHSVSIFREHHKCPFGPGLIFRSSGRRQRKTCCTSLPPRTFHLNLAR